MKQTDKNETNRRCTLFATAGYDLGLLFLRIFAGFMLLRHGIDKINNFSELSTTFPDPIGLGSRLSLLLIIATEVGGSLLVMTGLITRLAAFAIIFGMGVAAFIVHQPFTLTTSELPLLFMGMAMTILITGAGKYSLDEAIRKKICGRNK